MRYANDIHLLYSVNIFESAGRMNQDQHKYGCKDILFVESLTEHW